MNAMLDEPGILTAVQAQPEVCTEFWWGKRLAALSVDLDRADAELVRRVLAEAWENKAPRRLLGG